MGSSTVVGGGGTGSPPAETTTSTAASTVTPAPSVPAKSYKADVLIFDGTGTSASDAQSVAGIVTSHGLTQETLDSAHFNVLTADEIAQYRVLIWPGGDNAQMEAALTDQARKNARSAVVDQGVNYVGFCAGSFIAVGNSVAADGTPAYGLSIVNADYLQNFNPPNGTISMQMVTFADGSQRDLILWDGPFFNWSSGVIAKYSDGTGAIVQAQAGKGFAVLSGPHPEAPLSWSVGQGLKDTDGADADIAWKLIDAAYTGVGLPTF